MSCGCWSFGEFWSTNFNGGRGELLCRFGGEQQQQWEFFVKFLFSTCSATGSDASCGERRALCRQLVRCLPWSFPPRHGWVDALLYFGVRNWGLVEGVCFVLVWEASASCVQLRCQVVGLERELIISFASFYIVEMKEFERRWWISRGSFRFSYWSSLTLLFWKTLTVFEVRNYQQVTLFGAEILRNFWICQHVHDR